MGYRKHTTAMILIILLGSSKLKVEWKNQGVHSVCGRLPLRHTSRLSIHGSKKFLSSKCPEYTGMLYQEELGCIELIKTKQKL